MLRPSPNRSESIAEEEYDAQTEEEGRPRAVSHMSALASERIDYQRAAAANFSFQPSAQRARAASSLGSTPSKREMPRSTPPGMTLRHALSVPGTPREQHDAFGGIGGGMRSSDVESDLVGLSEPEKRWRRNEAARLSRERRRASSRNSGTSGGVGGSSGDGGPTASGGVESSSTAAPAVSFVGHRAPTRMMPQPGGGGTSTLEAVPVANAAALAASAAAPAAPASAARTASSRAAAPAPAPPRPSPVDAAPRAASAGSSSSSAGFDLWDDDDDDGGEHERAGPRRGRLGSISGGQAAAGVFSRAISGSADDSDDSDERERLLTLSEEKREMDRESQLAEELALPMRTSPLTSGVTSPITGSPIPSLATSPQAMRRAFAVDLPQHQQPQQAPPPRGKDSTAEASNDASEIYDGPFDDAVSKASTQLHLS